MARIDARHYAVDPGDNWAKIAAACDCRRGDLLAANGQPKEHPPNLVPGQIVHVPLERMGD